MLFRLVAVLALPALIVRLSLFRFRAALAPRGRAPETFRLRPYLSWVADRLSGLAHRDAAARLFKVVEAWLKRNSPGWRIYAWTGLVLSFGYNALSGLFFAVFIPRGLWGAPLLLHVMSGGLFAFSLAAVAVLRARRYGFEAEPGGAKVECLVCPVLKKVPIAGARTAAFWVFVLAGLVLAATAVASMLPYFVYTAQLEFLGLHRYAALAAVLGAIALVDLDLIPRRA